MYLYLMLNLGAILFPLLFSFHPRLNFYKEWKYFFPANFLVALIFILWDFWFTSRGVWGFNSDYVVGVNVNNLPIEEVLFFICIPFASMFTLHALKKIFPDFRLGLAFRNILTVSIITICVVISIFYNLKIYTFIALLVAAISMIIAYFYLQEKLDHFYIMYAIILIPFFIINGILTGTGIPGEVVWYDPGQIIGIRLLTIPVEDMFYGFALLLLNAMGMELVSTQSKMYSTRLLSR